MSPVPLKVVESERAHGPLIGSETDCVQGPLMLSETCTWPGALYWPNHPISRSPARTGLLRVYVYEAGPSAAPRVAVPCWAPAALDVMSSSNAEPLEVCARGVYGTPALLPGVTEPGAPPVSKAANTSSPAPTAAVAPVSTVVP